MAIYFLVGREGVQKGIVDTYKKTQRKKQREECQQQEAAANGQDYRVEEEPATSANL